MCKIIFKWALVFYISMVDLIFFFGLFNNMNSLLTFICPKLRKVSVGKYIFSSLLLLVNVHCYFYCSKLFILYLEVMEHCSTIQLLISIPAKLSLIYSLFWHELLIG
jgi:hypothetical protein